MQGVYYNGIKQNARNEKNCSIYLFHIFNDMHLRDRLYSTTEELEYVLLKHLQF